MPTSLAQGSAKARSALCSVARIARATQFDPVDYRVDLYHVGLFLLQVAHGRELGFSATEVLLGVPRAWALRLPPSFASSLEGALRRHVSWRTASVRELLEGLRSANASL